MSPAESAPPASAPAVRHPPVRAPRIEPSWRRVLGGEFHAPYMQELRTFLEEERATGRAFYPTSDNIFRAFALSPFEQTRVVVIGQDPYHGPGQAHGLSFSVPAGVPKPPSLVNIFKELGSDLAVPMPREGDLEPWSRQGVLLLNATLTVRAHAAGSHQGKGWERFTDAVVSALNEQRDGLVFVLWGRHARQKGAGIDRGRHHVLESAHPSPLSASKGFFGCRHFSQINALLTARGEAPIEWALPEITDASPAH